MRPEYTTKFYESLTKILDKDEGGYHRCRDCGAVDGAVRENKKGDKGKRKSIVRLALIDPAKPANDPNNVGFYCTTCRKGPLERKSIPKKIRDTWQTLFGSNQ